jgi:hypothetical protein
VASATDFVVVLGAISDARFREGEGIEIPHYPTPAGPATFRILTRYEDRGYEANVPTDLSAEVRGSAEMTLTGATEAFANTALQFLPLIAVATNAWIGDLDIKLAFDNTPGRRERDFLQVFAEEVEPDAIRFGRPIDPDAALAVIVAIGTHTTEGARLRRAAEQYRQALTNWLNGHEVMAIAHLWIAVEVLTPVALRREQAAAAAGTPQQLADAWGVEIRELDGEVRRRAIFQGDAEVARGARAASDGLEHGYLDFGEIRELARPTRDATARYVREAIISFADLAEPARSRLLSEEYAEPLRSWIVRYLRGRLVGDADDLAAPDEAYPTFFRTKKVQALSLRSDGSYGVQMEENFRSSFNDAVQFQPTSFEVWGARERPPAGAAADEHDEEEFPAVTGTEERTTTHTERR